ncbi:S-methyl-5-thioribose-1-phosphate isomerase [Streptomyces sp. DSM 42041]|uniref:Methylthioribose-1-phosphate isomerase n=1 Tax=Streptomyces hazeniae TaxID=3075538 RepID=A0ABU2P0B9_9ACTN|nr:S-methyl-5-thioribose-1-phosphate isomerase [Streptomyces sp. DSM 42041]MDT0381662.1 S-methyl-5-thioribose-1-phosphate isomerase [Streptomyces sp. DSM 42041]
MTDHSVPVLRWTDAPEGPAVLLLDQTRLPAEEAELRCGDVPSLVSAIRSLAVRGAPLLGIAGAYGVALAAARGEDVPKAAGVLAGARPTAVNLGYGARRVEGAHGRAVAEGAGPEAAAAVALAEARALHAEDAEASDRMAEHGRDLLLNTLLGDRRGARDLRLLTHCNTGSLVSGGGGTAFAVARAVHRAERLERLWVDETRPLLQGARLTAFEAERDGLPYSVLVDGAAGSLFAAGRVDAVLIGADRIAADGSTANKVGSFPLAVLARHHGVPFLVVAPVTTIDPETPDGAAIEIEQRSAEEVTANAPKGAEAYNPAFDVTPAELVTAIVTERGVVSPVGRDGIAAVCSAPPTGASRSRNGMMNS